MSILDTFFILFDADASKLDKGLADSDKKSESLLDKLRKVDSEATKTGGSFRDMVGKLAAFAGVNVAMGAFVHSVQNMAKEYVALGKLAAQFRSTVEAVEEFTQSAKLLGMSEEQSTESLHALDRAMQDTAMDMGRAKKVFEELGISVKDSKGEMKSTTAVMGELAGKFKGMDYGKQIRVMERLGLDPGLIKLFNSDLGALQQRMADVDRAAGFNLTTAVKRAQEYTKASKEMSLELNTLKLYLSKLGDAFKIAALPWFTDAMKVATGWAHTFVDFLMRHSQFVKGFMIAAGAAISYYLIPAAIRGALSVWAMIAPFALVGLAALAVATVFALLYDDITNFLDGNESLIGNLLAKYPQVAEVAKDIGRALQFVFDVAKALAGFLIGMWDNPGEAFKTFQADLMDGLNALFATFPRLREGFDTVMHGVQVAGEAIVTVWEAVVAAVKFAIGVVTAGIEAVAGVVDRVKGAIGLGGGAKGPQAASARQGDTQAATPGRAAPGAAPAPEPMTDRQRAAVALAQGQQQLAAATRSPLTSTTSNSISHTLKQGGDRNVTVEKIEVNTQATDAEGIAAHVGQTMGSHLRQANSQFDDGVAA